MNTQLRSIGTLRRVYLIAFAALALTLVFTVPLSAQTESKKAPAVDSVSLVVQNLNLNNVHIYTQRDGMSWLLGDVNGLSHETFTLPRNQIQSAFQFRIAVVPIGSGIRYITDPIVLGTGKEIDLTVGYDLGTTTYYVK